MNTPRAALAAILVLFASIAAAQQFKWTDKNGKTQYGDNPPPGVKATPMKPPPGPATQPAAATSKDGKDAKKGPLTPAEQEQEFKKRQLEAGKAKEQAEKDAQVAAAKKDNCDRARGAIAMIESGQRMSKILPNGERGVMDDNDRAAELARARKTAQDSCS